MNKKWYQFFLFMLCCFPCFVIIMGSRYLQVGILLEILFFIVTLFLYGTRIIKCLKKFLKNKYIKPFLFFMFFTIIAFFILLFLNKITIIRFLPPLFFGLIISMIFPMFFGYLYSNNLSKKDDSIKLILYFIFFILIYGIFDFITFNMNIPLFKNIFYILNNKLVFAYGENIKSVSDSIARIQSVFIEPSSLAWFLCCIYPIIYFFVKSNIKIFRNGHMNTVFKNALILLYVINILGTKSPINIVFFVMISIFCTFMFDNRNIIRKIFKMSFIAILLVIVAYVLLNSQTFSRVSERIAVVFMNIHSLEDIISLEPSLGTRIVYFTNMFCIFLSYPFTGCGLGSLGDALSKQLYSSPINLTFEIMHHILIDKITYTPSIFFRLLAETGVFGIFFFYTFLINLIKKTVYLQRFSNYSLFWKGVQYSLVTYILLSLYTSDLYCQFFWVLFGLIIGSKYKTYYLSTNVHKDEL